MDNMAINQLSNMEFMLYGGRSGMNIGCPSFMNGYKANIGINNGNYYNYYNPAFQGYYNKDIFTHQNDATTVNTDVVNQAHTAGENTNPNIDYSNPQFKGLSDDLNELGNYYVKNSAPSESLSGAAISGAAFGVMNNPRTILHPINTIKATFSDTMKNMFADVRVPNSELNKLYTNKLMVDGKIFDGGHELVSEAYARMHKLEALKHWKIGLFRRSLTAESQAELLKQSEVIEKNLASALKSGNVKEIAKWTEEAKRLGNRFTGWLPKGFRAIGLQKPMTWLRSKINPSQYQPIEGVVEKNIAEAGAKSTLGKSLTHSCGVGSGLFFAGMEFLNDMVFEHKIQDAFEKDSATGWKQVSQTAVKGAGSAIGWAVGEGIGAWAGGLAAMKIGATLGTTIAPGVGTAIGAVAGLIGGSIGCWLTGKLVHSVIGQDVGTLAKVDSFNFGERGRFL